MTQLSLLKKTPLFASDILARFREEHRSEPIPNNEAKYEWLRDWIKNTSKKNRTEEELEQSFNQGFWGELLNYTVGPTTTSWSAIPKPSKDFTGLDGTPDVVLGEFDSEGTFESIVVVELKKPGTPLDAPQPTYKNSKSPVEQAFDYAENLPPTRWVIVSDMQIVRLYGIDDQKRFHAFDLRDCINETGEKFTEEFRDVYFLLRKESLVDDGHDSTTARLVRTSGEEQLSFQQGFYDVYSQIRLDLLEAVETWVEKQGLSYPKEQQIEAVQRLLDRMIFIYFCEDHPDKLLRGELVEDVVKNALRNIPGPSRCKVYELLKQLFRDIDKGAQSGDWHIPQYNGELFKYHPIVDEVEIPDSLAEIPYQPSNGMHDRVVRGVWGLHEFDFWRELDRDLLGNIFERSIGDLAQIAEEERQLEMAALLQTQREWGIFYTSRLLARFAASSVLGRQLQESGTIQELLSQAAEVEDSDDFKEVMTNLLTEIKSVKVIDPACGSGIFLTAALDELMKPYLKGIETQRSSTLTLEWQALKAELSEEAQITESSIYGVDLLPQATELAKLALWLTAVRKDEISSNLAQNIIAGDTLSPEILKHLEDMVPEGFHVALGNPPWGGSFDNPQFRDAIIDEAGLDPSEDWDSWEVFVVLTSKLLAEDGRLGLILPDTIHSPEKRKTRDFILRNFTIEKMYNLGPEWFGPTNRMSSIFLQARKHLAPDEHLMSGMVLAGDYRRKAIKGQIPLRQIEAKLSHAVLQKRALDDPDEEVRVYCSEHDSRLMKRMELHSVALVELTERSRGEEMNAEGLFWRCPSCNGLTVPGAKKKGGGYKNKTCPHCSLELSQTNTQDTHVVREASPSGSWEPYIDGTLLNHRYEDLVPISINPTVSPVEPSFKPREIYKPPKLFIRQAGVGITATISYDWTRCPQSVYLYRCTDKAIQLGYTEEFILACLASRTMNYYILKRFGEVDPAKAHVKLTHTRLERLPIPALCTPEAVQLASQITNDVQTMVSSDKLGGETDYRIELNLRKLWGLIPEDGEYINRTFSNIPGSQIVQDLFPEGPPEALKMP